MPTALTPNEIRRRALASAATTGLRGKPAPTGPVDQEAYRRNLALKGGLGTVNPEQSYPAPTADGRAAGAGQVTIDPTKVKGGVPPAPGVAPMGAPTVTGLSGKAPMPLAQPVTSIEQRLADITGADSPVMRQARAAGERTAAARGLQNSSIAAGAAQESAIAAALPIAQQESQQEQARWMQGQEFGQQRFLQKSEQEQQRYMQSQEFKQQRYTQAQELGFRGTQAELDRKFQDMINVRDTKLKEKLSKMDIDAQFRIANLNVASHDREKASAFAAQAETTYTETIKAIMSNPDLPKDVRQQLITNASRVRDSNLAMVEQFYGIDLEWSSVPRSPPPPPPPPPSRGGGGGGGGSGGGSSGDYPIGGTTGGPFQGW